MGKEIEVVGSVSEKLTSKHFKKSIEPYKLLFENSGIPVFLFDINGTIILYNQAVIKIIGGAAKEYIGESLTEIFGDNVGREYVKRLLLAVESDVSLEYEDFVQLPSGNHWFLSNFTRIQNSEGQIIGIQVIWQNLTKHKQKIDTLSKSEEKLYALFSALTDVIIEIDSDGRLVEVLSLNPSLHSESYLELAGKTLHEVFPIAQADFILSNVKRTLEVGDAVDINHSLYINEKELIFEGKLSQLKSNSVLLVEREVTERKKAEEAVRSANLYNRSLIEASLDPLVTVGQDGKITDVNRATELVTGFSHKQLIGDDFSNYFTDSKKAREGYQKVLAEGLVRDYPLTIKHVSGKTIDVLYNATVYKNEKGEIQGVFAAARDITERKLTEETIRKYNQLIQNIIDNSPSLIYVLDTEGKFSLVNIKFESIFKIKRSDILGKTREPFMPKEIIKVHRDNDLKVINTKQSMYFEEENLESDGKHFYLSQKFPLLDNNGDVIAVGGISTDITDRIKTEETIRKREIEIRAILESTKDGILAVGKDGKVILTNKRFALLWKIPQTVLNSGDDKTLLNYVLDELIDPEQFLSKVHKLYNSIDEDYDTLFFKDGRIFERYSTSLLMDNINIGRVWSFRDITESKIAQQEILNSKQQLENLYSRLNDIRENERAEISREIHDELGQSLTALSMDLNWIKENAADKLMTETKIDDMLGIVKDTLKKVQKISSTLRPGMLDDLGLVPAIEWYCHEFEERTGIHCHLVLEKIRILDQKLTLTLFRILQEGLTNIIRHANAQYVEITLSKSKSKIFLKITDDGVGMSREKFQSKDSLGLNGMKERLKQFNGSLEIISTINKGTTLEITIPQNGRE